MNRSCLLLVFRHSVIAEIFLQGYHVVNPDVFLLFFCTIQRETVEKLRIYAIVIRISGDFWTVYGKQVPGIEPFPADFIGQR